MTAPVPVRYERRRLDSLVVNEANPRTIKEAARAGLAASLRRFGMVQAIVINERTGRIVGGHQRIAVLHEQGVTEVDVAIGSWDEADERALNVVLNNRHISGIFTDEIDDFLGPAIAGLGLDDFKELRLDALIGKSKTEVTTEIETGEVRDEFWISVRGPLAGQAKALDLLKAALVAVPGITVEIGTIKR